MSVKVKIAPIFKSSVENLEFIEVKSRTVTDALKEITGKFPKLEKMLFDTKEVLSNSIIVFVNDKSTNRDDFNKQLNDGDEIFPMLIIGGG